MATKMLHWWKLSNQECQYMKLMSNDGIQQSHFKVGNESDSPEQLSHDKIDGIAANINLNQLIEVSSNSSNY